MAVRSPRRWEMWNYDYASNSGNDVAAFEALPKGNALRDGDHAVTLRACPQIAGVVSEGLLLQRGTLGRHGRARQRNHEAQNEQRPLPDDRRNGAWTVGCLRFVGRDKSSRPRLTSSETDQCHTWRQFRKFHCRVRSVPPRSIFAKLKHRFHLERLSNLHHSPTKPSRRRQPCRRGQTLYQYLSR